MSEYENYPWNQNENQPVYQPDGGKHHDNSNMKKLAKKIGAIALSAVLFGGIAGGVFTGIAYASGATVNKTENQSVSASAEGTETKEK